MQVKGCVHSRVQAWAAKVMKVASTPNGERRDESVGIGAAKGRGILENQNRIFTRGKRVASCQWPVGNLLFLYHFTKSLLRTQLSSRGRGGLAARAHASRQGEPASIPGGVVVAGFSHVGIMPEVAAGRRVFPGIPRFSTLAFHIHLSSPSSALKNLLLRAALTSTLHSALGTPPGLKSLAAGSPAVTAVRRREGIAAQGKCVVSYGRGCRKPKLGSRRGSGVVFREGGVGGVRHYCPGSTVLEGHRGTDSARDPLSLAENSAPAFQIADFLAGRYNLAVVETGLTWLPIFLDFDNDGCSARRVVWMPKSSTRESFATSFHSMKSRRTRSLSLGYRTGRCRWSAGFLGNLPFPPPLQFGAAPYSPRFTLISSLDTDVKSLPNLPLCTV
ncbi:hypothetical protein PR048_006045 [Dryococelus australis]|uniref:Uncharacterized protein n=1 Tax=Dryococelus australis TaxID=614101 RepID=A0ABQ9I9V4_9NEOP|nr:hypothetical protein PR048_006045 [Dryococelus australis]